MSEEEARAGEGRGEEELVADEQAGEPGLHGGGGQDKPDQIVSIAICTVRPGHSLMNIFFTFLYTLSILYLYHYLNTTYSRLPEDCCSIQHETQRRNYG